MKQNATELKTLAQLPTLTLAQLMDGGENATAIGRNNATELRTCPKVQLWLIQRFPAYIAGLAKSYTATLTSDAIDSTIKDMVWCNVPTLKPSSALFQRFMESEKSALPNPAKLEFPETVFDTVLTGLPGKQKSGGYLRWFAGFFGRLVDNLAEFGEVTPDNLAQWQTIFDSYALECENMVKSATDLNALLKQFDKWNNPEGSSSRIDEATAERLSDLWNEVMHPAIESLLSRVDNNFSHANYAIREFLPRTKRELKFPNKRTGENTTPKQENAATEVPEVD